MKNINVVVYQRVSKDIQDFNRQVQDIEEYCSKNNYNIVESFTEKMSGVKRVRPAMTKLINLIKETTNIDFVICSELSRLGRTSEVIILGFFLIKRGVNSPMLCIAEAKNKFSARPKDVGVLA